MGRMVAEFESVAIAFVPGPTLEAILYTVLGVVGFLYRFAIASPIS